MGAARNPFNKFVTVEKERTLSALVRRSNAYVFDQSSALRGPFITDALRGEVFHTILDERHIASLFILTSFIAVATPNSTTIYARAVTHVTSTLSTR